MHDTLFFSFVSNLVIAGNDVTRCVGCALRVGNNETYLGYFVVIFFRTANVDVIKGYQPS